MSTPSEASALESVAVDAAKTFAKLTVPVLALAVSNHFQGQVVSISAVYQAVYAGVAAAAAVVIHGVPAALTARQKTQAAAAEAKLAKVVAAVRAAEAADAAKPVTPAV